jgi:hypothetical protein
MSPKPLIFDLKLSVVPILNARIDFNRDCNILSNPEFREQVVRWHFRTPIHAGYIIWGGDPSMLLTLFLQRAIIGIEAYIPPVVFSAAIQYVRVNTSIANATRDPFSLRGGNATDIIYNVLPGLVDSTFPLRRAHGSVWKQLRRFYERIRNPLFHGSQLITTKYSHVETLDSVLRAFELFKQVYNWVDWWYPPKLFDQTGTVAVTKPPRLEDFVKGEGSS